MSRKMFEIKDIDTFGSCVEILFDDWKDDNDIIKEYENIKEFTETLKDNSKCKECDKQPYDVFISLCDKRIAELKGESI